MQSTEQDVDTLNGLTRHVIDSANGYEEAADLAKASGLAQEFRTLASERQAIARDLQALVTSLGGTPETGGSIAGAGHRIWMDIKSAFSDDTKQAILEVERG